MKRNKLIIHLKNNSCIQVREGGKHTLFRNEKNGKLSTIPRHKDIGKPLQKDM